MALAESAEGDELDDERYVVAIEDGAVERGVETVSLSSSPTAPPLLSCSS